MYFNLDGVNILNIGGYHGFYIAPTGIAPTITDLEESIPILVF